MEFTREARVQLWRGVRRQWCAEHKALLSARQKIFGGLLRIFCLGGLLVGLLCEQLMERAVYHECSSAIWLFVAGIALVPVVGYWITQPRLVSKKKLWRKLKAIHRVTPEQDRALQALTEALLCQDSEAIEYALQWCKAAQVPSSLLKLIHLRQG